MPQALAPQRPAVRVPRTPEQRAYIVWMGRRIKEARERADRSQAELAKAIGRSQAWLNDVELGKISPSVYDLNRLAGQLEYPVAWFIQADYELQVKRPSTRYEWEELFRDDPDRARLHYELERFARDNNDRP